MSEPIVFISHNKIKKGKTDEFRKHYQDSISPIFAAKTGTLAQLGFENEEATEFTIVRLFPSADALDLQIQGADERSKKTYNFIEPISIEIFGTPNPFHFKNDEEDSRVWCCCEDQPKLHGRLYSVSRGLTGENNGFTI